MAREKGYAPLPEPLVVPIYDNHTHLDPGPAHESQFDAMPDYREQLENAARVGVIGVVQVGGDIESSIWSAAHAAREPRMLAAVAIHPNEAPRYEAAGRLDEALAVIAELATQPRVRAIGETGLDFFRTDAPGHAAQFRSFEAHIEIAKANDLALQIHDRDAHDAVIETLLRVGAPERTVFHCFSGDAAMAKICAEHGWYLSYSGTVTFKNSDALREALSITPRELILIETDAPFLAPTPHRGRPNAPYLMPVTLRFMADHLDTPAAELAAQLTTNTELVYGSWDAWPVTAE